MGFRFSAWRGLRQGLIWLLVAGACSLAAAAELGPRLRPPSAPGEDPNGARVIVKYKALGALMQAQSAAVHRAPQLAATMSARLGLALTDGRVIGPRLQVLHGDRSLSSAALATRLAADADVEYAVPDRRRWAMAVPNDPLYAANASAALAAGQWYLRAPDSTFVSAIDAVGAWSLSTGSANLVVADIDTGVLPGHPDLANKLVAGYDFITDVATAGDGNGRDPDPTDPGDWTTAGECGAGITATTSSWHGTQTSSLIGAQTGNAIGMASVGHDVKVQEARVLGKCGGYDSDIQAAMLWAGGLSNIPYANPTPARVLNLSLGSSGTCDVNYTDVVNQLAAAGVVVVAAAGNDGLAVGIPANCPGVIAVAGLRHTGTKVGYSDLGPEVAISAPAGNCVNLSGACLYPILTATNTGSTTAVANTYSDSTNYSVGTSFATPMVAGTVALMLSVNPNLTVAQVTSLLKSSARAFPTTSTDPTVGVCTTPTATPQNSECICTTAVCGAGMLDAAAAVAAAQATAAPLVSIAASSGTVTVGTAVSFDASGSTVPAGRSIARYAWTISAGSGVAAFTSGTGAATASVDTLTAGSFTVTLTVTDSAGVSSSASQTVTVNPLGAPTVSLQASATTVAAGSTVGFDGSGSTAAPSLSIVSYAWSIGSGASLASFSSGTTSATATVLTHGAGSGSFTVTLTVTDSAGVSSSRSQTISVTPVVPTASISASATTVASGGSIAFDGSGSTATSGRSIVGYAWALTAGSSIASISGGTSGPSLNLATRGSGSVTVQLTVTDSAGASASSTATVSVTPVGGSSGGGAMSGLWIALLALATVLLPGRERWRRRAKNVVP